MRDAVDVVVVGAGPIGRLVALDLITRYSIPSPARILRVLWIIRNAETREGIMRHGISMERAGSPPAKDTESASQPRIMTNELGFIESLEQAAQLVSKPDAAIVCVKAYSLDDVLASTRRLFPDSPLLVIANGILDIPDAFIGVMFGGGRLEDCKLILTKSLKLAWGRADAPAIGSRARDIATEAGGDDSQAFIFHFLFAGEGCVEYRYEPDISRTMLEKAIANSVINPLTAILDAPNEAILDERLTPLMRGLVREACEAFNAAYAGIGDVSKRKSRLFDAETEYAQVMQVARDTALNFSSMLQDIRAGRKTEVEWLNGRIVEMGRAYGVKTPLNEWVVAMIEALGV
jgi:ketopantoate reductase